MIKEFNDVPMRDSAVIYASSFEQVKKLYNAGKIDEAGELAICICEMALTNQHSSDDMMIDIMLENFKAVNRKDAMRYQNAVEAKNEARIKKQQLDVIADLLNRGYKQVEIAKRLNLSTSTLGSRVKTIRTEFPHLLNEKSEIYENSEKSEIGFSDKKSEKISEINSDKSEKSEKYEIGFSENSDFRTKKSENYEKSENSEIGFFGKVSNEGVETGAKNPKNPKNPIYDNVNVNVNDNVSPSSSIDEELDLISLEEVKSLGCRYKVEGMYVIFLDTNKKMKLKF
jgi:hypothetical protein